MAFECSLHVDLFQFGATQTNKISFKACTFIIFYQILSQFNEILILKITLSFSRMGSSCLEVEAKFGPCLETNVRRGGEDIVITPVCAYVCLYV